METEKKSTKCCASIDSHHKKIFLIVIALIMLAIAGLCIAIVAFKNHQIKNRVGMMYGYEKSEQRFSGMMNRTNRDYSKSALLNDERQFILPQDSSKSGELAIVVNDLEIAKKAVLDIASKNAGNIHATFISYASNDVKNGSIIVRIPAENFNLTFDELKKVGSRVIQESSQQIPLRTVPSVIVDEKIVSEDLEKVENLSSQPSVESQLIQNKGYIKIVFADYGAEIKTGYAKEKKAINGNILNIGNFNGQNVKNNLFVIVGLKLIMLVAIIGLLFALFKKIFHRIKVKKENKKRIHIVRQMPKTRARIVKIQKRK